jgi:5-methylthioadenosine/S-adenosylhomocysteine deaminase
MEYTIRQAIIPGDPEGYETVDLHIQAGRITEIAPSLPVVGFEVNAANKLLLPGFVNGHTHSTQIWQRGLIPPLPLELWLAGVFDTAPSDFEQVYLGALYTGVHTVLSGGTCLMDHLYLVMNQELETIAAAVRAYKELGIRAVIAPMLQDQPFVAGLPQGLSLPHRPFPRSTSEVLAILEAIIVNFHEPEAGIYIGVGPTGFQRCSDQLFTGCAALSDRYDLCRHTHLLETKAQHKLAQEKYGGSAVQHLHRLGFLDHRTSLAHGVWLDAADRAIVAAAGSTVVHNPLSNLRLGSGIAPVLDYLRAGVNISFGCDGAASNDGQDLLEAIKLGTILHNTTDFDYRHWITPQHAVQMAALGGAKGVNLSEQTGTVEVGKQADLVLYDLTNLSLLPRTDPLGLLIFGRPNQVVSEVWIRGQQVVAGGQVLTVDVAGLRTALCDRPTPFPLSSPTLAQVESHYRQVMNLDG